MPQNKQTLGTFSSFKIGKRYSYKFTDISKEVDGITYAIWIDPVYSSKALKNGKVVLDGTDIKYHAAVKTDRGVYSIKRNLSSKKEALAILNSVYNRLKNKSAEDVRKILLSM